MENLGTLTIRREIYLPDPYDPSMGATRTVTLATYKNIRQGICAVLIDEFCAQNSIPRLGLYCAWVQVIHL